MAKDGLIAPTCANCREFMKELSREIGADRLPLIHFHCERHPKEKVTLRDARRIRKDD